MTIVRVRAADQRDQMRALTQAFLVRFFDNEITSGTGDLKQSFFNLVAFLATPGLFFPVIMSMEWAFIAKLRGADALRTMSRDDKTLYLGLSMIATGLVAAVVWSSLLVDRRDGLVLGILPVRSRVIVQSKLLAVCAYVGLISVGMHATGSVTFGFLLAFGSGLGFALRGVMAHFIAASAASLFVFAAVLAVQGVWLAVLGPRAFGRVSAWLQMALVSSVLLGLIAVPGIADAAVGMLAGTGSRAQPWILSTPPMWFLGLYETILGTENQTLLALGRTAVFGLSAAAGLAALSYPLAYRRVMRDAVEHPGGMGRVGMLTAPARWLTPLIARQGVTRATVQFYLATLGRVERHRFTLAVAAGAALAWGLPTIVRWLGLSQQGEMLPLLALPLATMALLLVGLRVTAAVPSDLRAGWIFAAAVLPRERVRAGMRRVMLAVVVVPVALIASAVYWHLWGLGTAVMHGSVCVAAGWLLTEYLVRSADGMPCDQPWRPERANLKSWWPAYVIAFVLFATTSRHALAAQALASYADPFWYGVVISVLIGGAIVLRLTSRHRPAIDEDPLDGLNATEVLDLN